MDLVRPCAKCPFRNDIDPYLRPGRVKEIVTGLIHDQSFTCHETLDERGRETPRSQHCAGALILLEKHQKPTQLMRIFERLGGYDASKLDMKAPVFKSFGSMMAAASAAWKDNHKKRKATA